MKKFRSNTPEPNMTDETQQDAEFIYAPIAEDEVVVPIDATNIPKVSISQPNTSPVVEIQMENSQSAQEINDAVDELDTSYELDDDDDVYEVVDADAQESDDEIIIEDKTMQNCKEQNDTETEEIEEVAVVPQEDYNRLQEQYNRLMAEWDNYRKRTKTELDLARESANKNMAEAIIPTLDNFTLALDHSKVQDDPAIANIVAGFDAIYRSLMTSLGKEGLSIIQPTIGDAFDMNEHQAISRTQTLDIAPDTIAQVVQVGYKFKDKVIRPAMVVVNMS